MTKKTKNIPKNFDNLSNVILGMKFFLMLFPYCPNIGARLWPVSSKFSATDFVFFSGRLSQTAFFHLFLISYSQNTVLMRYIYNNACLFFCRNC